MIKLKKKFINMKEGFIVQVFYLLFYFLERVSLFYWIRAIARKKKNDFITSYTFPEIWAVSNPIFAVAVSLPLIRSSENKVIVYILGIYAAFRVLELFVYQINVLFFHQLNNIFLETTVSNTKQEETPEYKIKSAIRIVILLIINMIEYVIQFTVMYTAINAIYNDNQIEIGLIKSFQLFMNMTEISGVTDSNIIFIIYIEIIIGIFMNIICLARFLGMLPEVKSMDKTKE